MLLENPCPLGSIEADRAEAMPFQKVIRGISDQDYYDLKRDEKKAEDARLIEEAEPVVMAVERLLRKEHLLPRLLVETGIRESTLRALLDRRTPSLFSGRDYSHEARNAALATIAAWLNDEKQSRKAVPSHAPTPTLKAIYSILVESMECGLLSVIVGNYGMGKSRAAEVLVDEHPRSKDQPGAVLIELRREDNTVSKCIETILKRVRHDTHGDGGYTGLCRVLGPGDLLILDEAQRLATCGHGAMVEIVRDLWKDTGAGIVLIGNPVMKKGSDGIVGNDLYGAFLSRAELYDFTKGTTRADVEAWMLWKGLSGKSLADKLASIAMKRASGEFGGLRELEKLVGRAQRRFPDQPLTADLILEAIRLRGAHS